MTEFSREPLDLSEIDPKLHRHVQADAAPKLKMMAARAMLPAPPEQMVRVLYQLQFDADRAIQTGARDSLAQMPEAVLAPAIQKATHPGLLDWVGQIHARNDAIGKVIAINRATDDHTIVGLSAHAGRELADIIATNQVRVLRTPAIIEGLYKNPAVSSATIDALVELAQRNQVELKGLPGLNAALRSGSNFLQAEPGVDDAAFSALLSEEVSLAKEEDEEAKKVEEMAQNLTRSQMEKMRENSGGEDEDEEPRGNLMSQLNAMSISQKIRMATVGSHAAVKVLIRDQNKLVHMAAIRSPRVKLADVAKFASNKALPDGVIEYIANNRDWTQKYDIIKNLVHNPKTPLRESLKFLNHMRSKDLRDLARSRNVSHQVSRAAKALASKRSGV
ncbi:hypothetical protein [Bradymonas sediminis]|uniref:Uncharacterized protein n=1 Tax=Bradymonas sediminis TaxID=1548548 RepID=A0A2Z4FMP3_9DELT|nr:hypothetical protein [Bradymonas sediminis]AWV90239.1 hypothetical protein DN745_13235 [Bradymonas sediminis]TDP75792.1 hypothetical protein DFR33_103131 [Bradymonas sediminis]